MPRYQSLYGRGAYVPAEYRTWLSRRVAPLLVRHGLDQQARGQARGVRPGGEVPTPVGIPGDDEGAFPAGSLPSSVRKVSATAPVEPLDVAEQLSLL